MNQICYEANAKLINCKLTPFLSAEPSAASTSSSLALSDRLRHTRHRSQNQRDFEVAPSSAWSNLNDHRASDPRLDALFIEESKVVGVDVPKGESTLTSFAQLRLLKVLDVENVQMESSPDDVTHLLHLRYLSLENTQIKKLPNSVGKLRNLETSNLKGTLMRELRAAILKLQHLRYFKVYQSYQVDFYPLFHCTSGVKVPEGLWKLRSLPKLGRIGAAEKGIGTAKCISAVKKALRGLRQVKVENEAMANLETLTFLRLLKVPSCLQQLRNLKQLFADEMPKEFKQSLYKEGMAELAKGREGWADCVRHIPCVYCSNSDK
ncbi:hypothetical protein ACLOJK_041663 [Asimina triloba]